MEHICKTCHEDSTSHSFSKLCELNGVAVFYTKPADATKYTDKKGILAHYDNMMKHNGDKPWTWIFDSEGFGMKHALEVSTGIGIAKLITSKYSDHLQKILVKNPTWHIKLMYAIVAPFLSKKVNSMIEFMYENDSQREVRPLAHPLTHPLTHPNPSLSVSKNDISGKSAI